MLAWLWRILVGSFERRCTWESDREMCTAIRSRRCESGYCRECCRQHCKCQKPTAEELEVLKELRSLPGGKG